MPDVQPVDTTCVGPWVPYRCAMSAASDDGTSAWYRNGPAYVWSTSHSRPVLDTATYSSSSAIVPPTAEPMTTPVLSSVRSSSTRPESASASAAQASPNWTYRSARRISCAVRPAATGSKSASAATLDRNLLASKKVILRVAVRPAVSVSQNVSRVTPPGATTP